MLNSIHFLLTYTCLYECDHCFLYCNPRAKGTFTLEQLKTVFTEIEKIESIKEVYFEGGEPFLFYPLLMEGIKMAKATDLETGIVSNAYWATAVEDAELWLRSCRELKVDDLSLSDDEFHHGEDDNPAERALRAAQNLNIPVDTICIEKPTLEVPSDLAQMKGEPIVGGGTRFKGRAADKLTSDLPYRPVSEFTSCPYEDFENPTRVHLDSFGNVQLCQGISIGNMWEIPLSDLTKKYEPLNHPIAGPLIAGGPERLAASYSVNLKGGFVDECHYCYEVRKALLDKFPEYLAPKQVYGLEALTSESDK
ncbi:hypothetical protein CEE37_12695 [candidate division LCP-89 bacterium B3_LCP]|uniref:Radical SAM core domain-containing protein n=1 Tax=candidate division LCP-89 bacterium B3_LCP TaxID=2012998 RepID=A0A532UU30_UNCL8|nr:MAG: hypothetical protein CEE37_12695 [candidate division LCP-89 bacterium B3_LCP]